MDVLNKEVFSNNLQYHMDMMGVSRNKLSDDLGFPYTTISDWLSGKKYPRIDKIEALANYFKINKSDLIEQYGVRLRDSHDIQMFRTLSGNYSELTTDKKQKLVDFSEKLKKNEPITKDDMPAVLYESDGTYTAVAAVEKLSAGTGYAYSDNLVEYYYTLRQDLKPYDMATVVSGDSMTPRYADGDVVLVKSGYDGVNGDVYAVDYNGESFLKRVYNDGDRFRLVSINRNYAPIIIDAPIDDDVYLNIIGKVVDSFTPVTL